jgi:hypothetical protein
MKTKFSKHYGSTTLQYRIARFGQGSKPLPEVF